MGTPVRIRRVSNPTITSAGKKHISDLIIDLNVTNIIEIEWQTSLIHEIPQTKIVLNHVNKRHVFNERFEKMFECPEVLLEGKKTQHRFAKCTSCVKFTLLINKNISPGCYVLHFNGSWENGVFSFYQKITVKQKK